MNIPNLIGLGAAKSGTTTLAKLLSLHPQISMSRRKELHFFDKENFSYDFNSLGKYFQNFEESNRLIGEFTPSYLYMPESPLRIAHCLGKEIKLIAILRNPVKRAYSHYCHAVKNWDTEFYHKKGYPVENLNFRNAIESEPERLASGKYHPRHLSYFDKGLYANQLKRYFRIFGKERVHVVILEDFISNKINEVKKICEFLEVDPFPKDTPNDIWLNSQSDDNLLPEDEYWLSKKFAESINELEGILDRSLNVWRE